MKRVKKYVKQAATYVWQADSWHAWLVSVFVAFVIIKFVLYPLIGLIFQTPLPIVAVMSGSMQHTPQDNMMCGQVVDETATWWETCGGWYVDNNISKQDFESFSFANGFDKGDIMFVVGTQAKELAIGDVIVYQARKAYPLIHRITAIHQENDSLVFETKGDFNQIQIQEYALRQGGYLYACYRRQQNTVIAAPCSVGKRVTADVPNAVAILDETRIAQEDIIGRAVLRVPYLGYVKIWFSELLLALD